MTDIVISGMKQRGRGLIMNMSSISAIRPLPYMLLYGSTKAFIDYFSEGLAIENSKTGIVVQVCKRSLH